MAHITRSVPEVYRCNTSELRAYLDAGWRIASAEEYRIWERHVVTRGRKRAPAAPTLASAPAPVPASAPARKDDMREPEGWSEKPPVRPTGRQPRKAR